MTAPTGGRVRGPRPSVGASALVASVVAYGVLWLLARPAGEPAARYAGELAGAESILLLSWSLVIAAALPVLERAFGGLDREVVWHRRAALAGLLLVVPHVFLAGAPPSPDATRFGNGLGTLGLIGLVLLTLLAMAPGSRAVRWRGPLGWLARARYERWLAAHRLTGLFVAAAVVHGALVDPVLHRSPLLNASAWAVGGIGIAAYLYRELLARFFWRRRAYTVAAVERLTDTIVEVALEPVGEPLRFAAGQFAWVLFGGPAGWQPHPFTVSSAPSERRLRLSIKAVGDYTRQLYDTLQPGMPAAIGRPHGTFDYRRGGDEQIWIAAGIGVAPFLSWIRALPDGFDRDVDFYYVVASRRDAIFLDEIHAAAARHPSLRVHLIASDRDGRLTARLVAQAAGASLGRRSVYMCGPAAMMRSFERSFRGLGVPAGRIRWEQFGIR